jgi:hypothetical protein
MRETFRVAKVSGAESRSTWLPVDPLLGSGRVPRRNHWVFRAPDDRGRDLDGHRAMIVGGHAAP